MTGDRGDRRGTVTVPVKSKPEQWLNLSGDRGDRIFLATYQKSPVAGSTSMGSGAGGVGVYIGGTVPTVPTVPRMGWFAASRLPRCFLCSRCSDRFFRRTCRAGTRSPDSFAPNMKMEIGNPFPEVPDVTKRN